MRKIDIFIGITFILSTIAFGVIVLPLQLIPTHIAIVSFLILFVLLSAYFLATHIIGGSVFHMIRRSIGIFISCLLTIGCIAFLEFDHTISHMTEIKDDIIHVRLIARKESPDDLKSYHNQVVAITSSEYDLQQQFMDAIKKEASVVLKTKSYPNAQAAYEALVHQKVSAIIISATTYEALDQQFAIADKVRLVYEYSIEKGKEKDLLANPFHILIQGIDQVGSSRALSRSDVNMIASLNLQTKQILLTSIPRDAYIKNPCLNNKMDKLTHIPLQGSQCSIDALAAYFDIDIAYFVKLSFTSVISFVDLIGGVDVDVPMKFCEYDETKKGILYIDKGKQLLNGRQALAFARHRYTLYDGDMGRNRNQQVLLNALIKKTASPKMLANIDDMLSIMRKTVLTNLSANQLYSLIRFHFDDSRPYLMQNQSVIGSSEMQPTASIPHQKLSVVMLSEASIKQAKETIQQAIAPIDLSQFHYHVGSLRAPKVLKETTGAKGTNRCHIR